MHEANDGDGVGRDVRLGRQGLVVLKRKENILRCCKNQISAAPYLELESVAKETMLPKYAWQQVTRQVAADTWLNIEEHLFGLH